MSYAKVFVRYQYRYIYDFRGIGQFSREHLVTLSKLQIAVRHKDPFDHAIIAHAITEKLILISSDRQFENYIGQHLDFIYNKR